MSKSFVDTLIHNMKLADMVSKAAPWMVEGINDQQMNVRYVGLKLKDDWLEVVSPRDNLLIKFVIDRSTARIEYYLANKPPFLYLFSVHFQDSDKWETLLGELKRRLKRDKNEYLSHTERAGNLYAKMKPYLVK